MKNTKILIFFTVVSILLSSCGGEHKSEPERKFIDWAKTNVHSNYKIESISYDTIGYITDIIYNAYVLIDSKGGSTEASKLFSNGCFQYADDLMADTSLPTTSIVVAKVSISMPDGNQKYYIGMYKDSVATQPFSSGIKALSAMPQESLCLFIKSITVLFNNISEILPPTQSFNNVDDFTYKILTDPRKPKAPAEFSNIILEGLFSIL